MNKQPSTVAIRDLPPHRGLIVDLCFFAVDAQDAPAPYDGDPPADACTDCDRVWKRVDLDTESLETTFEHHFSIERSPGYYYVQLRVILFRDRDGKMFAQTEQFFFARRPIHIDAEPAGNFAFPVTWPSLPLEELHTYGTVSPRKKRPWWRLW